jgi:hypothetical protein
MGWQEWRERHPEAQREYYTAHREELCAKQRERYSTHPVYVKKGRKKYDEETRKQKENEAKRRWSLKNRQREKVIKKEWARKDRLEHPEKYRAKDMKRHKDHSEEDRIYARRRRQLKWRELRAKYLSWSHSEKGRKVLRKWRTELILRLKDKYIRDLIRNNIGFSVYDNDLISSYRQYLLLLRGIKNAKGVLDARQKPGPTVHSLGRGSESTNATETVQGQRTLRIHHGAGAAAFLPHRRSGGCEH